MKGQPFAFLIVLSLLSSITSITIISVDMHPSFATSDSGSSGDGDESESNDDNTISGNGPVTDPDAAPVTDPATTRFGPLANGPTCDPSKGLCQPINSQKKIICPDGYHKSPGGDCEKVEDTTGMELCPDGSHRSPSGVCEQVTDNTPDCSKKPTPQGCTTDPVDCDKTPKNPSCDQDSTSIEIHIKNYIVTNRNIQQQASQQPLNSLIQT